MTAILNLDAKSVSVRSSSVVFLPAPGELIKFRARMPLSFSLALTAGGHFLIGFKHIAHYRDFAFSMSPGISKDYQFSPNRPALGNAGLLPEIPAQIDERGRKMKVL